ncbi:MAG: arsenosugar biosynthesis radical SAM protein ArsS [Gammaproteobacteria bacterium]|nr:MAG: arsenosugar biosynthesis radical SAM protein ArsS [Gammaproteobacteria bacterium]
MHNVLPRLGSGTFPAIKRATLNTLQVNVGYRCNQSCLHCHVNAGPTRTEAMDEDTADAVIRFLSRSCISTLDITGGAPELNQHFCRLVQAARGLDMHVIDRCNLTVLFEQGQKGTAQFLADHAVEIIASMPCYLMDNVDAQRGAGVFNKSIDALRLLNTLGYGQDNQGLVLNLVYNPQGPTLPPSQCVLHADYKRILAEQYNVVFNELFTLSNMPINRFGSTLISHGQFDEYLTLLKHAHQDNNLANVMCRNLISVDWQGYVYDCDFNQMLGLPAKINGCANMNIRDLDGHDLEHLPIVVADHCFGCTAGQGSSCGGALDAA